MGSGERTRLACDDPLGVLVGIRRRAGTMAPTTPPAPWWPAWQALVAPDRHRRQACRRRQPARVRAQPRRRSRARARPCRLGPADVRRCGSGRCRSLRMAASMGPPFINFPRVHAGSRSPRWPSASRTARLTMFNSSCCCWRRLSLLSASGLARHRIRSFLPQAAPHYPSPEALPSRPESR